MFLIKNSIPKYDLIWYLTVPYSTRIERHASQLKHKENPDKIKDRFPGEVIFNRMESELKKSLNNHSKIEKEFSTSISHYEEIAAYMGRITKRLI